MIKSKMEAALNQQINEEMFSSYLYLSMAAYFESVNLMGFGQWMKLQAQEEMFHSMKFFNHIVERGGSVQLLAIKEPKNSWDSPLQVFEEALEHEFFITSCIDKLMDKAIEEKDHAARNLLTWFVDEQMEEEASFSEVLEKLKMIGEHKQLLLVQDKEMGARVPGLNPYFKQTAAAAGA